MSTPSSHFDKHRTVYFRPTLAWNQQHNKRREIKICFSKISVDAGIARNCLSQTGKTLLTKFLRKKLLFGAQELGKCQVIADVDSHDLAARSFVHTEVEKKSKLVAGAFGEGDQAASKKPALREGLLAQGWSFGVLWSLFSLILQTGLAIELLKFLALRKDLLFGVMNLRRCKSLPPDSSRRLCAPKFWTFCWSDNGRMRFL